MSAIGITQIIGRKKQKIDRKKIFFLIGQFLYEIISLNQ